MKFQTGLTGLTGYEATSISCRSCKSCQKVKKSNGDWYLIVHNVDDTDLYFLWK
jgi:hypothetical protein